MIRVGRMLVLYRLKLHHVFTTGPGISQTLVHWVLAIKRVNGLYLPHQHKSELDESRKYPMAKLSFKVCQKI